MLLKTVPNMRAAPLRAAVVDRPAVAAPAMPTSVRAKINYANRPQPGVQLFNYVGDVPEHLPKPSNMEHDLHEVTVNNLAHPDNKLKPTIERNGFTVAKLTVPQGIDWTSQESIEQRFWPAIEKLLLEQTGATRVHVFDSTTRKGNVMDPDEIDNQEYDEQGRRPPVSWTHVDYTTASGIARCQALLPDEAERLQKTPFAVIQVWVPLRGPVDASPLAMIDASSVHPEDYMQYDIYFPGRKGENYAVAYNPAHRWYYQKGLQTDEAYVFVCYDSRAGRARFTPHTGFKDPSTAPDAFDRESVESRAYVFWEDLPPAEPERNIDPTHSFFQPSA